MQIRASKWSQSMDNLSNEANKKLVKNYTRSDLRKICLQQDKLFFIEEIYWTLIRALRHHND